MASTNQWYVASGQERSGPLSDSELKKLAITGRLSDKDLVWKEGMKEWQPAGSIPGLLPQAQPPALQPPSAPPTMPGHKGSPKANNARSTELSAASAVSALENVAGRLTKATNTDPFRLADITHMFGSVFKAHSSDELEEHFGVGLPNTTPTITQVRDRVPQPWFFTRALLFLGLGFVALYFAFREFSNPNLIPALIFTGSFAAPLASALFFFECNLPANISLYAVLRMFTWGGILGLILTHFIHVVETFLPVGWLGASIAALTEEPAKLAAVVLLTSRVRYPWTLNGMCLGAAVGAGFAAFESAGYALSAFHEGLLGAGSLEAASAGMTSNLLMRGVLSPFGHVIWTAITAGALWRVIHAAPLTTVSLADWRFVSPFIAAVLLHFTWNSTILISLPFMGKFLILGLIAWMIGFGLLFTGFREVREASKS